MIEVRAAGVILDGSTLLAPTDLVVAPGEVVAVRGANGSGKTTLLRLVAGRSAPTTGTVAVAGRRVDDRDREYRRQVASLLGPAPFAQDLTVAEQLTLIATTWGADVPVARATAHAALVELGIAALA